MSKAIFVVGVSGVCAILRVASVIERGVNILAKETSSAKSFLSQEAASAKIFIRRETKMCRDVVTDVASKVKDSVKESQLFLAKEAQAFRQETQAFRQEAQAFRKSLVFSSVLIAVAITLGGVVGVLNRK